MKEERRPSGVWVPLIDPQLPFAESWAYQDLIRSFSSLPLGDLVRDMGAEPAPLPCFLAVARIRDGFQPVIPEFDFMSQSFVFDRKIEDAYGYSEKGQVMLKIQKPDSSNYAIMDIAGYIFGFEYDQMLVAAGSPAYVTDQVSTHYQTRFPEVTARALTMPNPNK